MRVIAAAIALSALSFVAGVTGDLMRPAPANAGVAVTLRIPPELPADAIRAAPLPPLVASADAAPPQAAPRLTRARAERAEPVQESAVRAAKPRADRVLHDAGDKGGQERVSKAKRQKGG